MVPDVNIVSCTEFYHRLLSSPSFCSPPPSGDGFSLRPEGPRGHDVHRHAAGLLPGSRLCSHPQVRRPGEKALQGMSPVAAQEAELGPPSKLSGSEQAPSSEVMGKTTSVESIGPNLVLSKESNTIGD